MTSDITPERKRNDTNLLYYYCHLSTAVEHILLKKQLRLNFLNKTNDPRENKSFRFGRFDFPIKENVISEIEEKDLEISKKLFEDCKVLCFSKGTGDNLKFGYEISSMWAHYADRHHGVCIEIDEGKFMKENPELIFTDYFKNIYYERFFQEKQFLSNQKRIDWKIILEKGYDEYLKKQYRIEHLDYLFFTKDDEWIPENEKRLIHFSSNTDFEYCSIKDSINKVYLGVDFEKIYLPSLKESLERISKTDFKKISVFSMQYNGGRMNPKEC